MRRDTSAYSSYPSAHSLSNFIIYYFIMLRIFSHPDTLLVSATQHYLDQKH